MIPLYNDTSVIRTHTCTVHLQVSKPRLSKYLDFRNRETTSNGTGGLIYINKELLLHLYLGLQIMFLSPWQCKEIMFYFINYCIMCTYSSNLQDAIIQSLTGLVRILCCVCRYRTVACKTIISWVVFFRCTHLLDGVLSNVLTQLLLILMRYDKVDYFLSQTDLMHQVTGVSRGGRTHTNN